MRKNITNIGMFSRGFKVRHQFAIGILCIINLLPQAAWGGELIFVDLEMLDGKMCIFVNGKEFSMNASQEWFSNLSKTLGKSEPIDVRCRPNVAFGGLIQFLNSIDATSWPNVTVRCVPERATNWREWISVPADAKKLPMIIEPSPPFEKE